jgi:hypothetical protein
VTARRAEVRHTTVRVASSEPLVSEVATAESSTVNVCGDGTTEIMTKIITKQLGV